MAGRRTDLKAWLFGSALLFSSPMLATTTLADTIQAKSHADAHPALYPMIRATYHPGVRARGYATHSVAYLHGKTARYAGRRFVQTGGGGISCVPYARLVSGISVGGNAWQWWDNAAGIYARGSSPEVGSVLAFRSNPRMRLGHVAVVSEVINPREILIDQANWPSAGMRGNVTHDVAVVDVSEANDWSAVRVELGRGDEFGSVYPTYGFIYDRPDHGTVEASLHAPAPEPVLNPVPSDLRPVAERPWHSYEEVAEAPATAPKRIELTVPNSVGGR
jgi:surface antigen